MTSDELVSWERVKFVMKGAVTSLETAKKYDPSPMIRLHVENAERALTTLLANPKPVRRRELVVFQGSYSEVEKKIREWQETNPQLEVLESQISTSAAVYGDRFGETREEKIAADVVVTMAIWFV